MEQILKRNLSLLLLLSQTMLLIVGCAVQRTDTSPSPLCIENISKPDALQIAQTVLSDASFSIDKSDIDANLLTTHPTPAAQFFEFWRQDNIGQYNFAQANLQSLRRTARLSFSEQNNKICIDCNVRLQRLSLPEEEVDSSSEAYRMFSESTISMQRLRLNPQQKQQATWIDLEPDYALASDILERIDRQIKEMEKHQK